MLNPPPPPAPHTTTGYHTHQTALRWALEHSHGPVLELGMGESSTPMLKQWCRRKRVDLVSGETRLEWAQKFHDEADRFHTVIVPPTCEGYQDAPDWNLFPFGLHRWAVALVDCAPSSGRLVAIAALAYQATFIVVHDTEQPLYYYEGLYPLFKWRHTFRDQTPHTTILSNYHPMKELR